MLNCIITCWAIRSFNLASEMIEELQDLRALAVRKSLCPRRWKGSVWEVGAFQAAYTVCSNRGSLVQKFSNLNGVGRRGPDCCAKSNGQWSLCEDESACRVWSGKAKSQPSLMKKRSSRINIGRCLSLLQVNLRFCRWISFNSQRSSAARNCRISLRFKFLLFLSLAL